jgi:alkylated DNA nucleotide flippase Atl1
MRTAETRGTAAFSGPGRSKKFTSRTSWRAKLEKQQEPKIVDIPPRMRRQWGEGKMLIPRPFDVDTLVREVPRGKLVTVNQIRARLASDAGADCTCPMVTGMFLRIAAEAAEEDRKAGKSRITPYWRVLRQGGLLNDKYPGGVEAQARQLEAEGHEVKCLGTGCMDFHKRAVIDFERRLVNW